MTKSHWRYLIRRAGLTQRQAARDLKIATSTIARWPESKVPPGPALYARDMAKLDADGQEALRAEIT